MQINTKSENKQAFTFNLDKTIYGDAKEIAKSLGLSTTAYMQMAVATQNNSFKIAQQTLCNMFGSELVKLQCTKKGE